MAYQNHSVLVITIPKEISEDHRDRLATYVQRGIESGILILDQSMKAETLYVSYFDDTLDDEDALLT